MLAAAAVGAAPVRTTAGQRRGRRGCCWPATRDVAGADRIAGHLADAAHLLVVASGTDRTAGRELVLKVEEGVLAAVRVPRPRDVPARPSAGDRRRRRASSLILTDRERRGWRLVRLRQALAAARALGIRSAAILSESLDPDSSPA